MRSRRLLAIVLLFAAITTLGLGGAVTAANRTGPPSPRGAPGAALQSFSIDGVWDAREYQLSSGERHSLGGQIFFVAGRWQVVFFVLDETGRPRRGSAEGGWFTLEGDELTFHHEAHLSVGEEMAGLPESALRMTFRESTDATAESARARLAGDVLDVFFPSGNRIRFERAAAP